MPHQLLQLQAIVKEPGYVYVYLSNENDKLVDVYFDDLKITHRHGPVIQSDSYYAFGLTHSSFRYESKLLNEYLYNGKEKQDELGLEWLDYGARMFMPEIGRWGVVDPLAGKYFGNSPYNYVANIPTKLVDPDGMKIEWDVDDRNAKTQIRRTIREAKRGSSDFRTIWRQLKKSDNVYTIKSGKEGDEKLERNGSAAMFAGKVGERMTISSGPSEGDGSVTTVKIPIKDPPNQLGGDIIINSDLAKFSGEEKELASFSHI